MKKEVKITREEMSILGIFINDRDIEMDKVEYVFQSSIDLGESSILSWNAEKLSNKQLKTLIDIFNTLITSNHKLVLEEK